MEYFNLGNFYLKSGKVLENAFLAYKTYGIQKENNIILYPTWYSGFISDNEWLIGEDKALNPNKYFIIIVCLIGNGQSSSPSNMTNIEQFPEITLYDNIQAQYQLIKSLGINKIKLVLGWSMGAQQTYQWGCLYPDMIENIIPIAGSAKTSFHNYVFLEGIKSCLLNGKDIESSLISFARVYAGWGFTQNFYKYELWKELGYTGLENFLVEFWEKFFKKRNIENLKCLIWTWQHGDISDNPKYNGNFELALQSITANVHILAPQNDLYFPKEDNMDELKIIKSNAKLTIIPGDYGHFAGGGINPTDNKFIDEIIHQVLTN
jgi:homoserine O-acetyltransferase